MARQEPAVYRALVGINYVSVDTSRERRVEAGGKIEGMNEVAARHELAAGHIEEWVDRQTENVHDEADEHVEVIGNVEGEPTGGDGE